MLIGVDGLMCLFKPIQQIRMQQEFWILHSLAKHLGSCFQKWSQTISGPPPSPNQAETPVGHRGFSGGTSLTPVEFKNFHEAAHIGGDLKWMYTSWQMPGRKNPSSQKSSWICFCLVIFYMFNRGKSPWNKPPFGNICFWVFPSIVAKQIQVMVQWKALPWIWKEMLIYCRYTHFPLNHDYGRKEGYMFEFLSRLFFASHHHGIVQNTSIMRTAS